MKIFLKILLASLPILVVIGMYIHDDPFKVVYHYDSYFPKRGVQYVILNKDYVSTETFINNYDKYHYDSYIFGNSRSIRYRIEEWEKHINSTKCFHFDASGECIYGIEKKMDYLHKKGVHIKNALFIIDHEVLVKPKPKKDEGHLFIVDPEVSGANKFWFQLTYLKTFFSPEFLQAYCRFKYMKSSKRDGDNDWMLFDRHVIEYHPEINEIHDAGMDEAIISNKDSFYSSRKMIFYERHGIQHYSDPTIGPEQMKLLDNIKKVMDEDHTTYKFVINPLYDQIRLDTADVKYLSNQFGKNNVYDYSGINDITSSVFNYYENSHYRPFIANMIMDSIYKHDKKTE